LDTYRCRNWATTLFWVWMKYKEILCLFLSVLLQYCLKHFYLFEVSFRHPLALLASTGSNGYSVTFDLTKRGQWPINLSLLLTFIRLLSWHCHYLLALRTTNLEFIVPSILTVSIVFINLKLVHEPLIHLSFTYSHSHETTATSAIRLMRWRLTTAATAALLIIGSRSLKHHDAEVRLLRKTRHELVISGSRRATLTTARMHGVLLLQGWLMKMTLFAATSFHYLKLLITFYNYLKLV